MIQISICQGLAGHRQEDICATRLGNSMTSYRYIGKIQRERAWLLSSVMRGTEHIAFDRCFDKQQGLYEFFVPHDTESIFLETMAYLTQQGVLLSLEKKL